MKIEVNKMVKMGVLSGLSIALMVYTRFPIIPSAPFLKYEAADVPLLIGSFMFGPLAGLLMTVVVSMIQALTLDADSGWVGFVMHVIASGTLVMTAGFIYRRFHTLKGAIIGLITGSLCMTLIMIPANLFFTVKFWGMPYDTVKALIVPALLPFNIIKSFANSIIVMLIYKSLSRIFKHFGNNSSK